jgi:hypothetical protein
MLTKEVYHNSYTILICFIELSVFFYLKGSTIEGLTEKAGFYFIPNVFYAFERMLEQPMNLLAVLSIDHYLETAL